MSYEVQVSPLIMTQLSIYNNLITQFQGLYGSKSEEFKRNRDTIFDSFKGKYKVDGVEFVLRNDKITPIHALAAKQA
jgi:hypothetical protein